jgi:peptide/nickel transport system permease protein
VAHYVLRRLALFVPTLFGVLLLAFVMVRWLPGDVADYLVALSGRYTPQQMQQVRHELDLDKPVPVQFGYYLRDLAAGDLGTSFYAKKSTASVVKRSIGPTVELAAAASIIAMILAGVLGVTSTVFYRKPGDLLSRFLAVFCLCVPQFLWGVLILLLPAIWFGWGPPLRYASFTDDPVANLQKILPAAFAVALPSAGVTARVLRSSLLQVKREDYVRTAKAKGLGSPTIYRVHMLKPALIPVLTVMGTFVGAILGGSVIAESIFGIPGMGQATLTAITQRDLPQIQTNILVFGLGYIVINLLVDLTYPLLDPRIRY